jgi:hypothetical protein
MSQLVPDRLALVAGARRRRRHELSPDEVERIAI